MSMIMGLTAVALAVSAVAQAADPQPALSDPTRPPSVTPAGAPDARGQTASAPRLQSILISRQRKLAVIDGRTVPLGGRVDEATLVQIAETHVVLKHGSELRTLELYPGIARTPVAKGRGAAQKKGTLE